MPGTDTQCFSAGYATQEQMFSAIARMDHQTSFGAANTIEPTMFTHVQFVPRSESQSYFSGPYDQQTESTNAYIMPDNVGVRPKSPSFTCTPAMPRTDNRNPISRTDTHQPTTRTDYQRPSLISSHTQQKTANQPTRNEVQESTATYLHMINETGNKTNEGKKDTEILSVIL